MEECKNQEGLIRINPKREGWIAEAAHITRLDQSHNGPDVESNILCLCPNRYVLTFDTCTFNITVSAI